jgi:hypothetical protein
MPYIKFGGHRRHWQAVCNQASGRKARRRLSAACGVQDAIRISRAGRVLFRMAKPTPANLPGRQLSWESEPIRDIQKKMPPWHAFKPCVLDKSAAPSDNTTTYGTTANPAVTTPWVV